MEYHKTKDILHVKELLGHKDIEDTMLYIQVEKALFREESDEYITRIVKTLEEAEKLVQVGFELVHDRDGLMLLRRRKQA